MTEQGAPMPSREGPAWEAFKAHYNACDDCEEVLTGLAVLCDEGIRLKDAWWVGDLSGERGHEAWKEDAKDS